MTLHNTNTQPLIKTLILLVICLAMFIFSSILTIGIGILSTAITGEKDIQIIANSLLLNAIVSIIIFGGSAYLYYVMFEKKGFTRETFCSKISWKWIIAAIFILFVALPIIESLSEDSPYSNQLIKMMSNTTILGLVSSIICMAFIPAIVEEWLFRGVLQRLLISWTHFAWIGIIITAAIFSLIHADMPNFVARMILGLCLGLLYYYSGNIWTNIAFHFTNNALAAIQTWYILRNDLPLDSDIKFAPLIVVISIMILVAFIVYNEKKNSNKLFAKRDNIDEYPDNQTNPTNNILE